MTENEWLVCADPTPMLEFLRDKASERKLRLLACACCRCVWERMTDQTIRNAVLTAEQFAEGLATEEEIQEAHEAAAPKVAYFVDEAGFFAAAAVACLSPDVVEGAKHASTVIINDIYETYDGYGGGWQDHSDFIRCICGNPFRPVSVDLTWLTDIGRTLATGIYADRAFDRLPILADALQDAGCDSDDLLNHLRGDGPHVLGCWALDLVLGKT